MITNKVKHILSQQHGIELANIDDSAHLVDDLGADSMDLLEIVLALEHEFEVKINPDEYSNANTVDKIVALITTKLAK